MGTLLHSVVMFFNVKQIDTCNIAYATKALRHYINNMLKKQLKNEYGTVYTSIKERTIFRDYTKTNKKMPEKLNIKYLAL